MELAQLEKILKEAEPYPGSICQLINDKGEVLISSGETKSRDTNYFSDSKKLKYSDVVVQLSCPKKAIYGQSTVLNLVTLGLLLLGMLLLAYIEDYLHHHLAECSPTTEEDNGQGDAYCPWHSDGYRKA